MPPSSQRLLSSPLTIRPFIMRITSFLAAALSLAVTAVEAGLSDFAIPAHIKPGDNFTVHIRDATTRFGEDRIYWGVNRVYPGSSYHSKVAMGRRFHDTKYGRTFSLALSSTHALADAKTPRVGPDVVIPGVYNGTISGLRLPSDLVHGQYTLQAAVVGFQGVALLPQWGTWSLPFEVAGFTDPHATNDSPNLVWASDHMADTSGCWVNEPGFEE